jgi:hypothetical protein
VAHTGPVRMRLVVVVGCCLLAMTVAGTALAYRHTRATPQHGVASRTVMIDQSVGETFTPANFPDGAGFLTADQVWQKWDHTPVPDSIPASYGTLTLCDEPCGTPGAVASENGTPVWAFKESYCLGGKPPASYRSCITWDYFSAKDGHQIISSSVPYP